MSDEMSKNDNIRSESSSFRQFVASGFAGDKVLWCIAIALPVLSILVIYSSAASLAYKDLDGDTSHFLKTQAVYALLNIGVMFCVHKINYQVYYRGARLIFWLAAILMMLTPVIGITRNDATRWIPIPLFGSFQPSDLMKVGLVMMVAMILARRQKVIDKMPLLPTLNPWKWGLNAARNKEILLGTTLPMLFPVALGCGLIIWQNFSTAAIAFATSVIMFFIGRVQIKELVRLVSLVTVMVMMLVMVMYAFDKKGRSATWVNRVTEYFSPEPDGEKVVNSDNFQKQQARIAIATGKQNVLFGKGPGNSTQRANLPHAYSDFAYAFIVEEYGILGAVATLLLYLWIFFRSILIFKRCGTAFPSMLVLGLGLMITFQAVVHMLVATTLFPVTGQPLPLVSKGGSSALFISLALGMILGVSRQIEEQSVDQPKAESLRE